MSTYGYFNFVAAFGPGADKLSLDDTEQQAAITKKLPNGMSFFFREDSICQIEAFEILLIGLKKDDVVMMWDWRCLVNPKNLPKASADVWDKLLKIHQCGASVRFVNGEHETKTAKGRYLLTLSIAGAQFEHDRQLEEVSGSTSSSSSSSLISSVLASCCGKNALTGC